MATAFGLDAVQQLLAEGPKFHMSGEAWWDATPGTLTAIQRIVKPGDVTFEIGVGASTVVFVAAGAWHTAVSPDPAEHELIRLYCKKIGLDDARLKFIVGRSDDVVPTRFSPERALDVALVDGSHSFPLPVIDWHYLVRALKIGGKMLLGDISIPAVAPIFRHMRQEPAWRLDGIFEHQTSEFTLSSEPSPAGAIECVSSPLTSITQTIISSTFPLRYVAKCRLQATQNSQDRGEAFPCTPDARPVGRGRRTCGQGVFGVRPVREACQYTSRGGCGVPGVIDHRVGWYVRRLGRMSPAEIAWRIHEQAVRRAWKRRQVRPGDLEFLRPLAAARPADERRFTTLLPARTADLVPELARAAVIADADRLLKGEWETLGVVRTDMARPDWFLDQMTGRRSTPEAYAFSLNQRNESAVGNVKQVWELNRLQHVTLLAVAWYLTGTDAYAAEVEKQLQSWWRENPFLSGVNWTSGIELGVRLINFAWIRRLLEGWRGTGDLFEHNDLAVRQIYWHQSYLACFKSRGSSANNHVIAEAAGQLVASCAFPWFSKSDYWRRDSARLLEHELSRNTFPSGINRELASDYHGFVAELGLFAAIEASAAGTPLGSATWHLLARMTDCMAALVDEQLQPPRQGDSDEGRVVLLDAPQHNRWPTLLALGAAVFGRLDWWPPIASDIGSVLAGALLTPNHPPKAATGRYSQRPFRFPDAGLTILRTASDQLPEIWCRCDGGPHGFLSIAAHAHADALSVEVRYGGVDILADPGTYCYHGEPEWRSYFQSTVAHNTVEIGGQDQSTRSGPFMWSRHARSAEMGAYVSPLNWAAEHDGYRVLTPPASHRRTVRLDPGTRELDITDTVDAGQHAVRMAFHFGPLVQVSLDGKVAELSWPEAAIPSTAHLELPTGLEWRAFRGSVDPILGWHSVGLGQKTPAVTLIGTGQSHRDAPLIAKLKFADGCQL